MAAGVLGRARELCAAALAALVILAGAVAGPAPAAAQQTVIRSVSDIAVEGNRRIEPSTVYAYLTFRKGEPVTDQQIADSTRRLRDTGLFKEVSITPLGSAILVQVVENPSINRVVFNGNDALDDERLSGAIQSAPRRPYTDQTAQQDVETLKALYRSIGRMNANISVTAEPQDENRVNVVFDIDEGKASGIAEINFEGNEAFSDRRLRGVINTSESGFWAFITGSDVFDPDRLEYDKELLRRYYLTRGYADFNVVSADGKLNEDGDYVITFVVDEGPVYTFGDLSISSNLPGVDADALRDLIVPETGDTYDAQLVDETIDALRFAAGQKGYAFAQVQPKGQKNEEARTVDVLFEIDEGPRVYVERIDIQGNTRTLDRVIRRQFRIVEGDAFNAREIREATGRIRALGFFKKVDVKTAEGSSPDRAVVTVDVEEQLTGSLSFGIGYNTNDGPVGEISVSEANFLGRGQYVRTRLRVAGDQQVVDLTFREPALLDRDLSAGFNVFYRQEDRTDQSSFETTEVGFIPDVRFPLSRHSDLKLSYEISSDEIRDVRNSASPAIKADEGTEVTSLVGATWTYDRRNDPVEPTSGYLVELSQDFAGLGGDAFYSRSKARVKGWLAPFRNDVIFSLEGETGALMGLGYDPRITDRFFLGGNTFRGFDVGGLGPRDLDTRDALGGKYYAIGRAEVSFPLGLPESFGVYGGLFADFGTVWGLDNTVFEKNGGGCCSNIYDQADLRASVGASIFIDSAFGPLSVTLAYPVVKESFDEDQLFSLTAATRF